MQIKVTVENTTLPIHVIHLDGNLDAGTYQDFQSKADDLITKGASRILVNVARRKFHQQRRAAFPAWDLHQIAQHSPRYLR